MGFSNVCYSQVTYDIVSEEFSLLNRYSSKTHILFFVVLGVLLYGFTLPYPFVFDSQYYLINNPLITDLGSFAKLLDIPDFAGNYVELNLHRDVIVTFILRPFANFTFYLNHLFGAFDPWSYRAINIAIHIFNTIVWYVLLLNIIRHRSGGDNPGQQWFIPFFSSIFFLVHPLATESVTYIIQRYASLGAMFYLATMFLFLVSLLSSSQRQRWLAYIGSVLTLVIGMLSKENLVTAPFALILMGTILLRLPLFEMLKRTALHFCFVPMIPFIMYLISKGQHVETQSLSQLHKVVDGTTPYEYILTQARVVLTYLRMLIAPYGQNLDVSYPLYLSIANPEIIISLMVLLLFVSEAVLLQCRNQRCFSDDLLSFCIFFALLTLSISSLFPLPDLMLEHSTYLFALPVITGLVCRIESVKMRLTTLLSTRLIVFLCFMAAFYSVLTVRRNLMYSSETSIWEDSVSKSPDKWRPNYNAGCSAVNEHHYEKAIHYFERAIQINPYKIEAYVNLGSTYINLSDYYSAIEAYQRGMAVSADEPVLLHSLGNVYREAGQLQDAIEVFEKSVVIDPDDISSYSSLAELYAAIGDRNKALYNVRKARKLDAEDASLVSLENKILKSR
jgi:tetratricopeptide (TPR) repeat protein